MKRTTITPRVAVAVPLLLMLAACASLPEAKCRAPSMSAVDDSLYFGSSWRKGVISDAEWAHFLEATVTPRFPQGLTVFEATGQWRGANGTISREGTRVLRLIHPDDAADDAHVNEIITAYKTQFEQESVLRVRAFACATF
jgi:hypothetical protein